jgi:type IV secretory pathway VirB3-like protein
MIEHFFYKGFEILILNNKRVFLNLETRVQECKSVRAAKWWAGACVNYNKKWEKILKVKK